MNALDKQVGGQHYKKHTIQPWHIVDDYKLGFYEGNALKYLLRTKGDRVEDLEKCIHYLEREVEILREAAKAIPARGVREVIGGNDFIADGLGHLIALQSVEGERIRLDLCPE